MNKYIIILGDIHANKSSLEELQGIFDEVFYSQKDQIEEILLLGDVFDAVKPDPLTLDFVTKILHDMVSHCPVTICTGNHESLTETITTLNYSQHFGVNLLFHHGIVERNGKKIYLGHHFLKETPLAFNKEKITRKKLEKQADLILLGHDHLFRKYSSTTYCLGSIMRNGFGEADYGIPKYAKIDPESLEIDFCDVKSAIPMVSVDSVKEALKTDPRTKLRLVVSSFKEHLGNIDKINDLKKRFVKFTVKHNYNIKPSKKVKKQKTKTFEESFNTFLKTVKVKEVKSFIKGCL